MIGHFLQRPALDAVHTDRDLRAFGQRRERLEHQPKLVLCRRCALGGGCFVGDAERRIFGLAPPDFPRQLPPRVDREVADQPVQIGRRLENRALLFGEAQLEPGFLHHILRLHPRSHDPGGIGDERAPMLGEERGGVGRQVWPSIPKARTGRDRGWAMLPLLRINRKCNAHVLSRPASART